MKIFDKKICHVTYTHSDYSDVWPVYFGEMSRYGKFGIDHYLCVDKAHPQIPAHVKPLRYDDSRPYSHRLLVCMEQLSAYDYILFDHEDMFLYDEPDLLRLENYYYFLKREEFQYIRLIKGGDCIYTDYHEDPTLFKIDLRSKWIFSIQPSFWKISVLIEMLKANLSANIWELELKSQKVAKKLNLKAAFSFSKGSLRGMHHYDNGVYPYVATAIGKGKWNFGEYQNELSVALLRYDIDPLTRGKF